MRRAGCRQTGCADARHEECKQNLFHSLTLNCRKQERSVNVAVQKRAQRRTWLHSELSAKSSYKLLKRIRAFILNRARSPAAGFKSRQQHGGGRVVTSTLRRPQPRQRRLGRSLTLRLFFNSSVIRTRQRFAWRERRMEFYLSFQQLLGRGGNSLALVFLPLFLIMTVLAPIRGPSTNG